MISEPQEFIKKFIENINSAIKTENPSQSMSRIQMKWLSFCLMGILLSNSINWAKFSRLSLGKYTQKAISWIFRRAKIPWDKLLTHSTSLILSKYNVNEGILVIDDSDKGRSKNAKNLHRLHKIKDKNTGGYLIGHSVHDKTFKKIVH